MKLKTYHPDQNEEIKALFTKTFSDSEGEAEGAVIGELANELLTTTNSKDLRGFVAMEENKIIGSILFTTLTFENGPSAFLLSPVAVHTDYQKQGIGQKLIQFGLEALKEEGVELAFTYGDPDYYSRVGFQQISEEVAKAPLVLSYPHGWLCQTLSGAEITAIPGESYCVSALNKQAYW
ncbi:N-acetyltransferase [Parasalinivibrio latis]|uniref:GNAT family N-acetyltransferase n=1 Tax=Parasalinivibrio latis TaxID=2952610 RepID=UPI0030DEC34D